MPIVVRRSGFFFLAIGVLLLIVVPARGLDPGKVVTQYAQRVWTSQDGLPQNTVYSIAQSKDGYLWIATEEGVARFDGTRFTTFDRTSETGFGAKWVRSAH